MISDFFLYVPGMYSNIFFLKAFKKETFGYGSIGYEIIANPLLQRKDIKIDWLWLYIF